MTPLSPRQREIVAHLLQGKTARQIGNAIGIKEQTVKIHLGDIYQRRCVSSRAELMAQLMTPTEEAIHLIASASVSVSREPHAMHSPLAQ